MGRVTVFLATVLSLSFSLDFSRVSLFGWTVESESVKPLAGDDDSPRLDFLVFILSLVGLGACDAAYVTLESSITSPSSSASCM